jgi:hypothetical protein
MFLKISVVFLFFCASIDARIFTCINQSGFDVGIGNNTIDAVINGNFCYLSMDNNFKGYAASFGLNIERRVVNIPYFKMYGMCGAFVEYGNTSSALLSSLGNNPGQEAVFGFTVLALRPEAVISPRISIYSNITLIKYETATQLGNNVWIFGFISSSTFLNNDAVPEIGIKFYF